MPTTVVDRVCAVCHAPYSVAAWKVKQGKGFTCGRVCSYARRGEMSRTIPATCKVETCAALAHAKGLCSRHYGNLLATGTPIANRELPIMQRLEAIGWDVMPTGCWEWRGRRNENNYGIHNHVRVHRLVFAHHNDGASPPVVRHTCDNPPCCNPSHLLGGTMADNGADMAARGRRRRSVCPNGHDRTVPGATRVAGDAVICVQCARDRSRRWEVKQAKPLSQRSLG